MRQTILEDNDFKLEVTREIDDNLRLTNTYKNDVHTDVEEMLLTKGQQNALSEFLLKDESPVQTFHICTNEVASYSEPKGFYLIVDREHDTLLLAAVDYDFSYPFKISQLQKSLENFERSNAFNAGDLKPFLIQQINEIIL